MIITGCSARASYALIRRLSATMSAIIVAATFFSQIAQAQSVDVTGTWSGFSFAGGSAYPNTFTLIQNGTSVVGTIAASSPSSGTGTFTGILSGNNLTLRSNYPLINYSSDSSAITDGLTMSGTFLDSQGTSGTFSATKLAGPLTPTTVLDQAPVVQVKAKTASIVLKKFTEVIASSGLAFSMRKAEVILDRAAASNLKIQYQVTVKSGKTILQKNSTRNLITFKNLPPGKYSTSYKVAALQGKKTVFITKKSPAAPFTITK